MNKWILVVCCFWASTIMAQKTGSLPVDSSAILQEVLLSDDKLINWAVGASVYSLDSSLKEYAAYDLAHLLASTSHIRIRNYGALASSSIRGAGAAHTKVVWNGLALNSPMTGQYDLSLVPLFFTENILVQSGGLSSLFGDGAIGGSIHLNNKPNFTPGNHIVIHNSLASFKQLNLGVKAQVNSNTTAFELAIHQHTSTNNFTFIDPYNPTEKIKQNHANKYSRALQSRISKKIGTSFRADLIYFYQESERLIPPILFEAISTAEKEEVSHRIILNSQYKRNAFKWKSQFSFISDKLTFKDSLKDIFALHASEQFGFKQELAYKINPSNRIRLEHSILHQKILSKYIFAEDNKETRYSFTANYHRNFTEALSMILSARKDVLVNRTSPFLPSLGFKYNLGDSNVFQFSLSRSYRNPSWNDLYWSLGGNPDLKPEKGSMANLSFEKSIKLNKFQSTFKLATYYGRISDWIIWLPQDNYWTPNNLALVEQKGLEFDAQLIFDTSVGVFKYSSLVSLQYSTNLSERAVGDSALGKQLIYVPLVQVNQSISWAYKSWEPNTNYHLESKRFTADDHSTELPSYYLVSVGVLKKMSLKSKQITIGFQIKNLLNQHYQMVQAIPMPGRELKLNLNYYL